MSIPVINLRETGANIKRLRKQNNIPVSSLCDVFGFSTPQAIYKWERGACLPTIDNLIILARLFNSHVEDVLIINDV